MNLSLCLKEPVLVIIGLASMARVYVFDPYSMALSKLARGFESDLHDVLFLLNHQFIALDKLESYVQAALPRAWYFDIEQSDWIQYVAEIKRRLRDKAGQ